MAKSSIHVVLTIWPFDLGLVKTYCLLSDIFCWERR